ncbi:hypothetical protein F5Y09DRAFT_354091 [Xylaria sp. FL1042]|nr:hypothetical protein F5Y09DRAFT_354091 [Xylaria sp. FL1042]
MSHAALKEGNSSASHLGFAPYHFNLNMLNHSMSLGNEGESVEGSTLVAQHSQKKYRCPQCPSSFKRPENLKRHERGHDESRRFVCQICDKGFARSDILARHVSIHTPLERRNDNPQRRRACRECAKARERCSRGEPCRRCTTKALCCLYPEDHQFKTMTPHTRSPLVASESDHHNITGFEWFGPQSPLGAPYGGEETLLQGAQPLRLQVEVPLVPCGETSILSTSPYNGAHPCQSDYHETRFASPFSHNVVSLRDKGSPPWSSSNISTDDMQLIGDPKLGSMSGVYNQATNMPLSSGPSSNGTEFHQTGFSAGLYDHCRSPSLDMRDIDTTFYPHTIHGSNSYTHPTTPGELESLDLWKGHQYLNNTQTLNIDFDDQETTFDQPYQEQNAVLLFDVAAATPTTTKHYFVFNMSYQPTTVHVAKSLDLLENQRHNQLFMNAIWELFAVLRSLRTRDKKEDITLELSAHPPSNAAHCYKPLQRRMYDTVWANRIDLENVKIVTILRTTAGKGQER